MAPTASTEPGGRIRALNVLGSAIAEATRTDDVLELVAEETRRAIDADELAISRFDPERDELRVLVSVGHSATERFPVDERYTLTDLPRVAAALHRGEGYRSAVDDPDLEPGEAAVLSALGRESQMGAAVMVGGRLWGELWAGTLPGSPRFAGTDVDMLRAVAGYVAIGVARLDLLERLHALASTDSLTGLRNHREFHQTVERLIAERRPFALVTVDVDDFKAVNDSRGHAEGDRVLARVSAVLGAACRAEDAAFRLGGDELAIVLPGLSRGSATALARRVQRRVADTGTGVTVSVGTALWPRDGAGKDAVCEAADRALYAAKRARVSSSAAAVNSGLP